MAARTAASFVDQCSFNQQAKCDHSHRVLFWTHDTHAAPSYERQCNCTQCPSRSAHCYPCTEAVYMNPRSSCCYFERNGTQVPCGDVRRHGMAMDYTRNGGVTSSLCMCSRHHHSAFTPVAHSHFGVLNPHHCQSAPNCPRPPSRLPAHNVSSTNCCLSCHHGLDETARMIQAEPGPSTQHSSCEVCNSSGVAPQRSIYSNPHHHHRRNRHTCRPQYYTQAPLHEVDWYQTPPHCSPFPCFSVPLPIYAGLPFGHSPAGLMTRSTLAPISSLSVEVEFHAAASETSFDTLPSDGLSKDQIEGLTTYQLQMNARDDKDDKSCVVCLSTYEDGDTLRVLPCCHEYHRHCVDQWLQTNKTCPICRAPVVDSGPS